MTISDQLQQMHNEIEKEEANFRKLQQKKINELAEWEPDGKKIQRLTKKLNKSDARRRLLKIEYACLRGSQMF